MTKLLPAIVLLASVSAAEADPLPLADHPLVDTIVRASDGASIERPALEAALADADFVILGEKHDNPRHHAIQAELVHTIGLSGTLQAVAFEMLPRDKQLELTLHLQDGGDAATLADAVGWDDLGWGPWTWYGPIAHAALNHEAELIAADLSRGDVRAVYQDGLAHFPAAFRTRTGLDGPLEPTVQAALEALMVDAHCGHDLGDVAARMVDVQRARDAMMADRLATLAGMGQGILITGNGHADTQTAVPAVLAQLRPEAAVVSLGLIEVEPDWRGRPDVELPYDYVWFTPRAKPVDHDYCAALNHSRG